MRALSADRRFGGNADAIGMAADDDAAERRAEPAQSAKARVAKCDLDVVSDRARSAFGQIGHIRIADLLRPGGRESSRARIEPFHKVSLLRCAPEAR